ncbi:MAG: hypothetical protein QM714_14585 [Nocardioides sp.]|uniref:hypothetical protein n=1 Tax=Nocardioides sp. TaxID=35761 RepID=UPI0039E5FC1C
MRKGWKTLRHIRFRRDVARGRFMHRHGHTVGYFIPVKEDRAADVAALRAAGEKLDALLSLTEDEVDAAIEDFKQLRREGKKKA